ncbi:MAG: VOC family protein [Pararhodobacter sp.]|nr:VOC family protein [Pararhodobacter sp.]
MACIQSFICAMPTENRVALDRAWEAIGAGGRIHMQLDTYSWAPRYGWLKDRFGLSWQIIPRHLTELLSSSDPKVMESFMQMGKIDISALERAAQ